MMSTDKRKQSLYFPSVLDGSKSLEDLKGDDCKSEDS